MTTPPPRATDEASPRGAYVVAIILAVGICTALNILTVATVVDALFSVAPGISENATQILTGWGGGVVGVIGAVVGYNVGHANASAQNRRDATTQTGANTVA